MERRSMGVDALRLLIIGLVFFCCLVIVCSTVMGYTAITGRTFSQFISSGKEMVLVALGILGGVVTGHVLPTVDRRKQTEEPKIEETK